MSALTAYFRSKAAKISARYDALYQRTLRAIGIEDCPEMQVVAAVAVSILLWYICVGLQLLYNLITATAPMLTALLTNQ